MSDTLHSILALADAPESRREVLEFCKLLSEEVRFKIFMHLLREGELHVGALCERVDQSQPAVSHHLAIMRIGGMLETRRDGKRNFYSVDPRFTGKPIMQLMLRLFLNGAVTSGTSQEKTNTAEHDARNATLPSSAEEVFSIVGTRLGANSRREWIDGKRENLPFIEGLLTGGKDTGGCVTEILDLLIQNNYEVIEGA